MSLWIRLELSIVDIVWGNKFHLVNVSNSAPQFSNFCLGAQTPIFWVLGSLLFLNLTISEAQGYFFFEHEFNYSAIPAAPSLWKTGKAAVGHLVFEYSRSKL